MHLAQVVVRVGISWGVLEWVGNDLPATAAHNVILAANMEHDVVARLNEVVGGTVGAPGLEKAREGVVIVAEGVVHKGAAQTAPLRRDHIVDTDSLAEAVQAVKGRRPQGDSQGFEQHVVVGEVDAVHVEPVALVAIELAAAAAVTTMAEHLQLEEVRGQVQR